MDKIRVKDDIRYQNLKKKHRRIQQWFLQKLKEEYKNKELSRQKQKDKELENLKVELKELIQDLKQKQKV